MSCGVVELDDIEDLFKGEAIEEPRKAYKNHQVKKNNKKKNKENKIGEDLHEYDPQLIANVPGAQRIYVKTFGCSHNMSDSEFMMGQLSDYGYEIVDNPQDADLYVINSCTVKNPSQDAFMTMVTGAKKINKPLVVAGCVPQGDKNIPGLENVSILGVTQIDRIVEVVEETLKGNKVRLLGKKELPSLDLPKIRKNKFIEIIPINTGCLGSCTYCKTKHARGKLGSYQPEAIAKRIKHVITEGVKEIWITSEDTGAYGRDIGTNISELLTKITEVLTGDVMLRIGMTNPPYILEHLDIIAQVLNHPKVYSFIHIPVQSGSDIVLEKMNREYTIQEFNKVCDYLLEKVPGLTIATDIICGFPEETNENHEETMKLIRRYKFPILNISQFYPRPGTAAAKMNKCDSRDVKARSKAVTDLFESYTCYDNLINTEQLVWIRDKEVNKKNGIHNVGHTKGYVKVLLPEDDNLLGKCVKVKITATYKWHIVGDIIDLDPKLPDNLVISNDKAQINVSEIDNNIPNQTQSETTGISETGSSCDCECNSCEKKTCKNNNNNNNLEIETKKVDKILENSTNKQRYLSLFVENKRESNSGKLYDIVSE